MSRQTLWTDEDGDKFSVITDDRYGHAHVELHSPIDKESMLVTLPDVGPQRDALVKAFADALGVRVKFR